MEEFAAEDLEEIETVIAELEISKERGNLLICTAASPTYRQKVIDVIAGRFPVRLQKVEGGDELISKLKEEKGHEVLIWEFPERLSPDLIEALNNFRELFYRPGAPSLLLLTPSALDDVIRKAPDLWRYCGGYHELKGREGGLAFQVLDVMTTSLHYRDKEDLLRRKRIDEHLLQTLKDERERIKVLQDLGGVHYHLGEVRQAIEHYEQALEIAREIGDRRSEGIALGSLGNAYAALGESRRAIELYEQSLAIYCEIGDRRSEGAALCHWGAANAALGETRRAIEHFEQALEIARNIGDKRGEGATLGNMGAAYADLGETRRAIELYEQALAIDREIGDRRGEGVNLSNLGEAYAALGETRRAIELYEQALTIARNIGDRMGEGNALWNMALAYESLGEAGQAIESPRTEVVRRQLARWQEEAGSDG